MRTLLGSHARDPYHTHTHTHVCAAEGDDAVAAAATAAQISHALVSDGPAQRSARRYTTP